KPAFTYPAHADFVAEAGAMLEAIQSSLYEEARARRDANITRGMTDWAAVADHFEQGGKYPGWVEVEWAKPTGAALDAVVEKLKALKLTIRNVPRGGDAATGTCIFTGAPATERILIARAY
ncbi:MAG TPA: proline--tRNA ligase, partial [Erythrobacter sp.]|nr:proline--tRNA ligase [Erythrobacter sp.]